MVYKSGQLKEWKKENTERQKWILGDDKMGWKNYK